MGLLDLCEQFYSTRNLYEVLQISENATEKEVKKAYHKLSLRVHPDRVAEEEKLEATEKFKVLGSIHAILSDKEKRTLYDTTKSVDEDELDQDWTKYWRFIFKKITVQDIKAYEKEYIGSKQEREDLKQAYITSKGDMDLITIKVQFAKAEHEPRYKEILNEMIKEGEIPTYKIFTHEPAKKRQRRHAKERREAKEAEEFQWELGENENSGGNSLEQLIKQKQEARTKQMDSFIDNLAAKYGGMEKKTATKRKSSSKAGSATKKSRK